MGFIENIAKRFGFVRPPQKRGYNAATVNRLTFDWAVSIKSADADIRYSLSRLRARSRELAMNNDYARKYLGMCVTNIVGPAGITFQNKVKDPGGVLDKNVNNSVETAFDEWAKKGSASVCGKLSWIDIQRLVIQSVARDGEVLVRKVRGAGNKYRFALQVIEADLLDENYNLDLGNGNQIRMGVESDKWGRPVAYHVFKNHPGDYMHGTTYDIGRYERIPAEDMVHLFDTVRPGQSRGVPWMHSAMTRLNMLGGYEEAELVAARVGASKMGFFTKNGEGNYDTSAGAGSDEMLVEAEPGTFETLPEGMDFKPWDPTHPAGNFPFFLKAMLRGVASGLGVAYNSLASDLESVNYSSIRAGSIEERDNWRIRQGWFIEQFCQPVFEGWLDAALINGLLGGAKPLPYSKFDKFNAPSWKVRGWEWVDPLKDMKANIEAVNSGMATRTQILAEQGLDIEQVFEELAAEKKLATENGLDFTVTKPIANDMTTQTLQQDGGDQNG